MTWTYVGPSSSTRDEVRFRIGDVDSEDPQLTDAEIDWLVSENGSSASAAIAACYTLEAKYARLVDRKFDDIDIKASQRAAHYRDLRISLQRRSAVLVAPFAGGISVADMETREGDTDRVAPAFTRQLHEQEV